MSKPDLTLDEPTSTGWLRGEFFGNEEQAKGYLPTARKVLGAMKTHYGVNERVANGEPGGFYREHKVLPDGTRIEAITNDGQDTLRITVPTAGSSSSESWSSESELTSFEGTRTSSEFTPEWPGKESEEPPPPPLFSYRPYLWIGARIVSGPQNNDGTFKEKLHVCVWEPPSTPSAEPVILSNRNQLVPPQDPPLGTDKYPLQQWMQFLPAGNPDGIAYTNDKLFMLLPINGLPMRIPDYQAGIDEDIQWDVIFIADPDNDLNLQTDSGPMASSDSGGDFLVKVMVVGPDCGPDRFGSVVVELRIITGKDDGVDDSTHQFTITEFTEYKMGILPKGWFPTQSPPAPNATVCDTCSVPVPDFGANPHGPHWWQGMADAFVAPLQVDVPQEQLAISTTTYSPDGVVDLPPTGFEPGGWPTHADRCPACVSTQTTYNSLGYSVPTPRRTAVGGDYPGCGPITTDITKFSMLQYFLNANPSAYHEPILPFVLSGKVTGAVFTGIASGGSKFVSFTTAPYTNDGSYTYSIGYGPAAWWSEDTKNYPQYTAGSPFFGFCISRTAESLEVLYETDYESYLHAVMDVYPYEWRGDGMLCYYKIITVYDKNGNVTSSNVTFITKAEFDANPDRFTIVCGRTEQD